MSYLIKSRLFLLARNVTLCDPDGDHAICGNLIQIIPSGIPLEEALVLIKHWRKAKMDSPEESDP
jgi:hypothetical protein